MGQKLDLLMFPILLTGCSGSNNISFTHYEYDVVSHLHISYEDVFNQWEDIYYIYYYQVDCYYCHGIKSKMIHYGLYGNIKMYFIEITEDYGFLSSAPEDTIGTSNYLEAFCKMTPQLSLVKDHIIVETYVGDEEILLVIE